MTDTVPVGATTGGTFGWTPIDKPQAVQARANLIDYDRTCREFSWEKARSELAGLPDGGLNIAYEAVDRQPIVGFGAAVERPCAVGGLLGVRPQVTTTLAADHRVSDGAVGARFLNTIAEMLQHPEQL